MTNTGVSTRDLAVILASGGLDSCVAVAVAQQTHRLALLHVNYGQKTETRELQAFHDICDFYGVEQRMVTDVDHLRRIGGSSLTDRDIPVAEGTLSDMSDNGSGEIPTSYVPFRNSNLLSIAVSWGEAIGAKAIFIGAMEEDSSGYPDCREDFFKAFDEVIRLGTRPETAIKIKAPLLHLAKAEVVRRGVELEAPLELTWSCYQSEAAPCGRCESCLLRRRAFERAEVEDPLTLTESE